MDVSVHAVPATAAAAHHAAVPAVHQLAEFMEPQRAVVATTAQQVPALIWEFPAMDQLLMVDIQPTALLTQPQLSLQWIHCQLIKSNLQSGPRHNLPRPIES
ncbi:MAG TPA: hypothetical protein DD473_08245 [Planctomycetaceae bacterium]|nr:hypothetical protein [Planctomycetaceae bacterium]